MPEHSKDIVAVYWRTGTKAGRTIWAMVDGRRGVDEDGAPERCDNEAKLKDVLIGVMDTAELADAVVEAHNQFGWVVP